MSTVFATDFSNGYVGFDNAAIGCPTTPAPKTPWGCNGGFSVGPCDNFSAIKNVWSYSNPQQQLTVRARESFAKLSSPGASERLIFFAQNHIFFSPCTECGATGNFSSGIAMRVTGELRLVISTPFGASLVDVSTGVIEAFDGMPHGYQLSLNFLSNTQVQYQAARDGSVLLSGTANAASPWTTGSGCLSLPGNRAGVSSVRFEANSTTQFMNTLYQVEVDDAVLIKSDYGPCPVLAPALYQNCNEFFFVCPPSTQFGIPWQKGVPLTSGPENAFAIFGGVPPFNVSIVYGSLPPGIVLNPATGQLSGTPTGNGGYAFKGRVVDNFKRVKETDVCIAQVEGDIAGGCPA